MKLEGTKFATNCKKIIGNTTHTIHILSETCDNTKRFTKTPSSKILLWHDNFFLYIAADERNLNHEHETARASGIDYRAVASFHYNFIAQICSQVNLVCDAYRSGN